MFPLVISFADPLVQASLDLLLFWIIGNIGLAINPKQIVRKFYQRWFEVVGDRLGLTTYLFGKDHEEGVMHDQPQIQEEDDDDYEKGPFFPIQIATLILLAWSTLLVIITTFITVPCKLI